MHEMSIAENILEIVKETLRNQNSSKLLSVTVQVGELTAVIPESLSFCFETVVENTPYKGAKLKIVEVPLTGKCKNCGKEFHISNYCFICPNCESTKVEIIGGQELNVSELEVE